MANPQHLDLLKQEEAIVLIWLNFPLDLELALGCMLLIGSDTTRRLPMTIQEVAE